MLMNSFLHHVEVGVGRKGSVKGILPDVMVVIESLTDLVTFGNRLSTTLLIEGGEHAPRVILVAVRTQPEILL